MHQLRHVFMTGFAGVLALLLTAGIATAQPSTPLVPASQDFPVAIHEGVCDNPTLQPAFEIANTVAFGAEAKVAEFLGGSVTQPVLEASATVDASLEDIANGQHVIAVHASPEEYATIVACGEIAGPSADGKLVVALTAVDEFGVSGIAIFDSGTSGPFDLGDDQVHVTVYLVDQGDGMNPTPTT